MSPVLSFFEEDGPRPSTPGPGSPEHEAFRCSYVALIEHIKLQPDVFCDFLFQEGLINESVREYVRNHSNEASDRARKLVDSLNHRIKSDPKAYHSFIEVTLSIGDDGLKVIENMQNKCEECRKRQTFSSQIETDQDEDSLSDVESFHSTHSLPVEDYPGFVCPYCRSCSLERFYSEEGCPKKKELSETKSLFPFLDVSALGEDQIKDLTTHLKSDTREIIFTFAKFTRSIKESFKKILVSDIVHSLVSLKAFISDIGIKVLDAEDVQELRKAKSHDDVFIAISDYISFYNYHIIEHLINLHGSPEDQDKLKEYVATFDIFCQKKVFEIPLQAFSTPQRTGNKLAVKCTADVANLSGIRIIEEKVTKVLNLRPSAIQLCSITDGCIELHYLIPTDAVPHIFPLTSLQERALCEIGVQISLADSKLDDEDGEQTE